MTAMKKALLAILLSTGCSSSGGQGEKMTETDFETKIATSIAFDPALLAIGDRVVYFVKRAGETETQKYSWAAVAEDGQALWIENKVPFDPRPMVVKTKLDRSGKVLEQWIGEPGGIPGQTYPSQRTGDAPKHVRDSASAKADSKEEPDRITVGGKPYDCTRVTTVLSYPDGRKSTMINWFSREVPFAASKTLGGLIKRQFGRLTMELVAGDKNGKSELQIPPK
jgi:hypothetical protein